MTQEQNKEMYRLRYMNGINPENAIIFSSLPPKATLDYISYIINYQFYEISENSNYSNLHLGDTITIKAIVSTLLKVFPEYFSAVTYEPNHRLIAKGLETFFYFHEDYKNDEIYLITDYDRSKIDDYEIDYKNDFIHVTLLDKNLYKVNGHGYIKPEVFYDINLDDIPFGTLDEISKELIRKDKLDLLIRILLYETLKCDIENNH